MKIYTKTGDAGETSLSADVRVAKDDLRIETNGMLDELNAYLGVVRAIEGDVEVKERISRIQQLIMQIMGRIAIPESVLKDESLDKMTAELEYEIDLHAKTGRFQFSIPGDNQTSALVHVARTVCRTAERRLWTLNREQAVGDAVMRLMNRLSDYLFVLADIV